MSPYLGIRRFGFSLVAVSILGAVDAHAHPGHGLDAHAAGLLHFMLDPAHGGIVALAALAVFAAARVVARGHRD
jgi:hypothetical protein